MLRSRVRKVLGLILAVLVLGVGFCLFDGAEGGHVGLDLCLGMLVTSLTVLVYQLPLTGLASADRFAAVLACSARILAPPPKTALLPAYQ